MIDLALTLYCEIQTMWNPEKIVMAMQAGDEDKAQRMVVGRVMAAATQEAQQARADEIMAALAGAGFLVDIETV